VLLSDTVGFIQKLPTMLVAAFRATLEEISEADLLVHVLDASHPAMAAQAQAVQATLEEIGAGEIPMVTALNKVDLLADPAQAQGMIDDYDRAVAISGLTGHGLPTLLRAIEEELESSLIPLDVRISYEHGGLLARMYESGVVESVEHEAGSIHLKARLPRDLAGEVDRVAVRPRRRTRREAAPSRTPGS
jgi:GTP-binding protein HflX